jgi:putative ABC transport system ATP-binding protein
MNASTEPLVQVNDLWKIYGSGEAEVDALQGVSLDLQAGELAVILGPSGSGKTTLLNIMGGIETLSKGSVVVNGNDLASLGPEDLATVRRENLGFVFQFFNLVPTLTAEENVQVIAELTNRTGPKMHEKVTDALESVDLSDRGNHFPGQMSGGQQQRVAMARALVMEPKLLLCDEPTGALDLDTGRQVLALLKKTAVDTGCCVVLVTHNSAIADMADRVIVLRDGKIESNDPGKALAASAVTW